MTVQDKLHLVPSQNGTRASGRCFRMNRRPKVELVPVEADSDTQRALERLIVALEKQGFKIIRKEQK